MDFIIGTTANRPELAPLVWNPDGAFSVNPHLLICGSSGAGKTTLLLAIAKYLALRKKHIFIFDLKGDMVVKDDNGNTIGNYIEFTAWDSEYGINPFEFDTGVTASELEDIIKADDITRNQGFKVKNSGPKVQVDRIIEIIKKNFLPNMGTAQKDMLMYLLADTYLIKGIVNNKISTWNKELPNLKDTLGLISRIKEYGDDPEAIGIDETSQEYIKELKLLIVGLKSLESRKAEEATEEVTNLIKKQNTLIKELTDEYVKQGVNVYTQESVSDHAEYFKLHNIDMEKYQSKGALRTIEKLSSYINALVESGVFHSTRPPVKNGLNVINISGLDVGIQKFIVDIWLGKVFKSCKIKGTYSQRAFRERGEKCDTYVMIDESKLIAGTSRDKNDPYSYLNRIATEARGIGLGLIVAAQSAEHFPPEFLKNFYAQMILNTGVADAKQVISSFGIKKEELAYTQIAWGNALVKTGKGFMKVKLSL